MGNRTLQDLQQLQALPLSLKIALTKDRIRQWINEMHDVAVSFSGGKDSTVLLDIARQVDTNIKAVFVDTGLEYPEIRDFVRTFDNVDWVKPKMNFRQVIERYGYPMISKEVSDCVQGARRYIESLIESKKSDQPTDQLVYAQFYRKLRVIGEYCTGLDQSYAPAPTSLGENELEYADSIAMEEKGNAITSKKLREAIDQFPEKATDHFRVKRLMGTLPFESKSKTDDAPEKGERSAFNCERYQFFLDAPFEISNRCCKVMKKNPVHSYTRKTGRYFMTAEMAEESRLRKQQWLHHGCNGFDLKIPKSMPMAFWTEQDVLQYIVRFDLPICEIYGDVVVDYQKMGQIEGQMSMFIDDKPLKTTGSDRTGCAFCGYGIHLERNPNRFEMMKETHPQLYDYIMRPWEEGGLNYKEILTWINENGNMDIKF